MTYSLEAAAELLYRTTGIAERPENCDGLAACLNAAVEAERAACTERVRANVHMFATPAACESLVREVARRPG